MLVFGSPQWHMPPRDWQVEAYRAAQAYYNAADPPPAVISAIMGAGKSLLIGELAANVELAPDEHVVISTSTQHLVEDIEATTRQRCHRQRSVGVYYGRRKRLGQVIVSCTPSVKNLATLLEKKGRRVALWIADECHRTEAEGILSAYAVLKPKHSLGMTATPFRASSLETLSLFKKILYRYGVKAAKDDGVVVDWNIVHSQVGGDLDEACMEMIEQADGPGLANATDIEDAEEFADKIGGLAVHSKLHPKEIRARLKLLEGGVVHCVVHVNILTEGANFPWLRWLCLRRQVGSRVRFVQEIGRLLRSHPGKTVATFYDPHDLFGNFRLSYAEALGEPPDRPPWEGPVIPREFSERIDAEHDPAIAMAYIESAIRALTVAADVAGMMHMRKLLPKAERLAPSNRLQQSAVRALCSMAAYFAPAGWQACLRSIAAKPDVVRFGFAADLLTCLNEVINQRRWPPIGAENEIQSVPDVAALVKPGPDGQYRLKGTEW